VPRDQRGTPELQTEVQRLIGRCMLRLQQYERLMKTILAHHELVGSLETWEARRSARVDKLADKSLGTLVNLLFETYAVADGYERELLPEKKAPSNGISVAYSHRLTMEPERLARTRVALEELVAMRNEMVHHLIERFDLWSNDGCLAALHHLKACYDQIDLHHNELTVWAKGMDDTRKLLASFAQSDALHDMLENFIASDGAIEWSSSEIVQVLREANQVFSKDGWAPLDKSLAWIASRHPEQTPDKYSCQTWPQVLSESRVFDMEYRAAD
jgi:hypothetical protein